MVVVFMFMFGKISNNNMRGERWEKKKLMMEKPKKQPCVVFII